MKAFMKKVAVVTGILVTVALTVVCFIGLAAMIADTLEGLGNTRLGRTIGDKVSYWAEDIDE
jgi:hypothetical protein